MPRDDAPRTPTVSSSSRTTTGDAAQREIAGEREAGEAGAGDDDRIAPALARAEVGRHDDGQLGSSYAGANFQTSAAPS